MPLRVHCPSGCFIRVPANRAGKIVRCPACKQAIRLDRVSQSEIESGKAIPMKATIVEGSTIVPDDEIQVPNLPSIDETSSELAELPDDFTMKSEQRERLIVPEQVLPSSVRSRKGKSKKKKSKAAKPAVEQRNIETASLGDAPSIPDFVKTPKTDIKKRVVSSKADRVALTKFFAVCLCLVALVNLAPALYFWYEWSKNLESTALPRWIYLQAFIAAIHFIYAVFLVQIPDWSALKAVSIAMLVVAFIFGMVSTGLLTGGGQGTFSRFLEIPHVMAQRASIWCVAMLLLSTLLCYMGGRESANWQRTEQLLREILTGG